MLETEVLVQATLSSELSEGISDLMKEMIPLSKTDNKKGKLLRQALPEVMLVLCQRRDSFPHAG